MKMNKNYMGFLIIKNIANFEAFWRDKNFTKNLLFLGSDEFGILLKQPKPNAFGAFLGCFLTFYS